jgi:hypothetical protein
LEGNQTLVEPLMGFANGAKLESPLRLIVSGLGLRRLLIADGAKIGD